MKRTIELSFETAIKFYKRGGEFKELALSAYTEEELIMASLPTSWDEFCKLHPVKKGEVWIGSREEIGIATENSLARKYRNWLPSKESAKKHLAFMQLEQLRDCYRQGWVPTENELGVGIVIDAKNRVTTWINPPYKQFLSFKDIAIAFSFIENFEDLIREACDLI